MTRWFVHLSAESEEHAHEKARKHGEVVAALSDPAPDGSFYWSVEVVPPLHRADPGVTSEP